MSTPKKKIELSNSTVQFLLKKSNGDILKGDADDEFWDVNARKCIPAIYDHNPTDDELKALHSAALSQDSILLRATTSPYEVVHPTYKLGEVVTVTGKVTSVGASEIGIEVKSV